MLLTSTKSRTESRWDQGSFKIGGVNQVITLYHHSRLIVCERKGEKKWTKATQQDVIRYIEAYKKNVNG